MGSAIDVGDGPRSDATAATEVAFFATFFGAFFSVTFDRFGVDDAFTFLRAGDGAGCDAFFVGEAGHFACVAGGSISTSPALLTSLSLENR